MNILAAIKREERKPARLSDSRPFDVGGEKDMSLFFAEDLHGFYAGGA